MVLSYKPAFYKAIGPVIGVIFYGTFAYSSTVAKLEPSADCYAAADSIEAIPADTMPGNYEGWVNVSARFQTLLEMAFWIQMIRVFFILPMQIYFIRQQRQKISGSYQTVAETANETEDPIPKWLNIIIALLVLIEIVWVIIVFC